MTQPVPKITDAQWAAQQAALAFQDGRYALGEAFGRLALKAHVAGLHQQSTSLTVASAPVFDAVSSERGFFDPAADDEPEEPSEPPATARCLGAMMKDGVPVDCHAGIYLDQRGDERRGVWRHINPDIDGDHFAWGPSVVTDPAQPAQSS